MMAAKAASHLNMKGPDSNLTKISKTDLFISLITDEVYLNADRTLFAHLG